MDEYLVGTGIDEMRARQLLWMIFGIYEKSFYSREYEVIGDTE